MATFRLAPLLFALLTVFALLAGCQREEPPPAAKPANKPALHVVVPAEVTAKWKAVRIVAHDKQANRDLVYTVDVGGRFILPETALQVEVAHFLPAFVTDGTSATSTSSDAKNPGVEIVLSQGGVEIDRGWLFKTPPQSESDQHQLAHPRYSFRLEEVVARR